MGPLSLFHFPHLQVITRDCDNGKEVRRKDLQTDNEALLSTTVIYLSQEYVQGYIRGTFRQTSPKYESYVVNLTSKNALCL
jgi:hypothetical protein